MAKIKTFFLSHKYFFAIFGFILFYELVVVRCCEAWRISDVGYSFLALDYNLGFASAILPGAVFHLFFKEIDSANATLFITVVYLFVIIAFALFFERLLCACKKENRRVVLLPILFFLVGPASFSVFFTEIGAHEFYWFFLAILFILCMRHPPLYVLAVPLCVCVLLVNWNALICVVPFFCILLLYRLSQEEKKGRRVLLSAVFGLCAAISIPLALYLVQCTPGNMKYTLAEFRSMMQERGVEAFNYLTSLLYKTSDYISTEYMQSLPETISVRELGLWNYMLTMFRGHASIVFEYQRQHNVLKCVGAFLAAAPGVYLFESFFWRQFRDKSHTGLQRFTYFCMFSLFIFSSVICLLTSFDYVKWLSINSVLLTSLFFCVLYHGEQTAAITYLKTRFSGIPSAFIFTYFLAVSFLVFHIYY